MKLFICIVMLFAILACSPNKNESVYDNCILRGFLTKGDTSSSKATFDYDASGRLVSINYPTLQIVIAYGDHQITMTEPSVYRKYIISNDSLAIYRISQSIGGGIDSTVYQYDSERYLIKQIIYLGGMFADSAVYKYKNGNRVNWTRYNKTGMTDYSDIEYDENLVLKTWYLQNLQSWPDFYYPWLGKPNKNLIREQKIPAWGTWVTTSYKINASGYVTQFTNKNEGAGGVTDTHDVIYDCQ